MQKTCLITGGAGFIGCAMSAELVKHFDRVVAVDNMHPQIHSSKDRPAELSPQAELIVADVTQAADWDRVLADVQPQVVIHLAAETGTGQSLLEATRHAEVNVVGTTQMLDAFSRNKCLPERIVLASSRAVYGEGMWEDAAGQQSYPGGRSNAMLKAQQWDFTGLKPMPQCSATVRPDPSNVYASTKLAQEHLLTAWCAAFGVEAVRFRLQNVYGPGQSLINPYTGIVSLFARLAKAGESIPVYEDGDIVRDFVFITDVAAALVAGALHGKTNRNPYDIGLGERTTILELAQTVAEYYGAPAPHINGMFRDGDVRAAWAVIDEAKQALDWQPQVGVREGIRLLCEWIDAGGHNS